MVAVLYWKHWKCNVLRFHKVKILTIKVISQYKYGHKKLNERRAPSGRKHQLLKYIAKNQKNQTQSCLWTGNGTKG
jgi:hypothetical protein